MSLSMDFLSLQDSVCNCDLVYSFPEGTGCLAFKEMPAVFVSEGCFNKAPQTRHPKLGTRKQQQGVISRFWRLEVWSQGVGGAVLPLKLAGDNPSMPASGVCWHSVVSLDLWMHRSTLCVHDHMAVSLYIYVSGSLLLQGHQSYWIWSPPYSNMASS